MRKENVNGNIFSISEIFEELKQGNDGLFDWVSNLDKSKWFLNVDDEITQANFGNIVNWVMENSQFKMTAKNEFLSVADPWLIAKAMTENHIVVTQEKSAPQSKRKIYIPDVCSQFNVPYIDTVHLLRNLGGSF